jgi:hypothetical protein
MCWRLSSDEHSQRSLFQDVGNQATRDIIQFILGNTISENELIEFTEVSGGDGTNQDQNMLYVSAVKAAARSLGSNVKRPIRNMLAWRIVRLDEELRKYQGGDFCPSTLARALRDPGMHPQQGGMSVPCVFFPASLLNVLLESYI